MEELVAFLLARFTEDEGAALAARSRVGAEWLVSSTPDRLHGERVFLGGEDGDPLAEFFQATDRAAADHIARHDPHRVLVECEVKVQTVRDIQVVMPHADPEYIPVLDQLLRYLVRPYVDHPDYREEWEPAQ